MGRPSKSAAVLKLEGKSHRTKQELAFREAAEKNTLTGKQIIETEEVRTDPEAHKEFLRCRRLLRLIEKDDEIYGAAVRRYCLNKSRLKETDRDILRLKLALEELEGSRKEFTEAKEIAEYYRLMTKLEDTVTKKEQLARSYRMEMTDFEKENCMTIRSSLKSIPKKPETKTNSLRELLNDD